MRRKLTTLRAKQGHSQNGAPRQLIDEAVYRERIAANTAGAQPRYDSEYSGWSNSSRPRDQAISLRSPNARPTVNTPVTPVTPVTTPVAVANLPT